MIDIPRKIRIRYLLQPMTRPLGIALLFISACFLFWYHQDSQHVFFRFIANSVGAFLLGVYIVVSLIPRLNKLRVLQNGTVTAGTFIKSKPTAMFENRKRLQRVYFNYFLADGTPMKSYTDTVSLKQITDEKREFLIYNNADPKWIELIDDYPELLRTPLRLFAEQEYKKL